jgi:valyl-tRNA synthetase
MTELSKTFDPQEVEKKWYELWSKKKYFKPRAGKAKKSHCIIMPPPNVTGRLHMGHALDVVTQDVPTRFKRMKGYQTLFLPGMDHAGIATQSKVEQELWENEKKTKHDISREEFLDRIWKWKEEHGGTINEQQRSLGASCDWDYLMFTMDDLPNQAVRKAFVSWYNQGLIYQSDYIINWDPKLQSAISDAEVEHEDVKGKFYHIHYQVKGEEILLEVATTRPETLLGDTAVAVHPEDERFKHLIGKTAIVPICGREVPIVGDDYVDREKGTGCLKVTPGHDFNDFEIGRRHNLEIINILNKDGTLNEKAGQFQGLSCSEARKKVVEQLKTDGLFVKDEDHIHSVGHGQRSGVVIEPMVSKQWFLNTKEMAQVACDKIDQGETHFLPKQWENTYFAWLREPKNWCISRQLVWGHRIPVFTCASCEHQWASEDSPTQCPQCQASKIEQDPDVLDTWFSSGLWPLSTLGWPDPEKMKERGFETFYPTTTLVTGYDIIFFWVARMMMMCTNITQKPPFEKVYIHAIVRDKFGRKMSKSLGNGIDPLEMVKEYGADALRFTLATGSGYNRNINLDPARIEGYRNFVNKIWNAFRFVTPFLGEAKQSQNLHHHEKWILGELNQLAVTMNESLESYRLDEATNALYSFIYDKFCGYFIELSKPILYKGSDEDKGQRAYVLRICFQEIVKLLHPVCPYITEELWTQLKSPDDDLLIIQDYPEDNSEWHFEDDRQRMEHFIEVVTAVRNLRSSVDMKPKDEITICLRTRKDLQDYFQKNAPFLDDLARVKELKLVDSSPSEQHLTSSLGHTEIFLMLDGQVDLEKQVAKLKKERDKTEKELSKLTKKLENPKFTDKAPKEIVDKVKFEADEFTQKLEQIKISLAKFS